MEEMILMQLLREMATRISNECGEKYRTEAQVLQAIETAIAKTGHPSMQIADAVPEAAEAESNVFYLVMNTKTNHYDIYMLIDGTVQWLDDTTVDLSDYSTTEQINSLLDGKVDKDGSKVLSDVNFSTADKEKLDGATKVEKSDTEGNVKINGVETAVVNIPTVAEVQAMLNEVFGA